MVKCFFVGFAAEPYAYLGETQVFFFLQATHSRKVEGDSEGVTQTQGNSNSQNPGFVMRLAFGHKVLPRPNKNLLLVVKSDCAAKIDSPAQRI